MLGCHDARIDGKSQQILLFNPWKLTDVLLSAKLYSNKAQMAALANIQRI